MTKAGSTPRPEGFSPNDSMLGRIADAVHSELSVPQQNDLFQTAVEAGYLAALADGEADATERAALIAMMLSLSDGLVVEWEVDALIDEANERIQADGFDARADHVGKRLRELGNVGTGLLVAAYVALSSCGLDPREVALLKRIGDASGVTSEVVANIVKRARTIQHDDLT